MDEILSDLSAPALSAAIRWNFIAWIWGLREHWPQAEFAGSSQQIRWFTPLPLAYFNAAVSLQPPQDDESACIEDTIAFYRSRGRTDFNWLLAPGLEGSDWGRQLEARGLAFEQGEPGMALDLALLPERLDLPSGLSIQAVTDEAGVRLWNQTFVPAYGLPPSWEPDCLGMMLASLHTMTSYLGFVDGQPVATASLLLAAGVAGIYSIATLPDWRGKGIGAAMTLYPLFEARRLGCRAAVLQSSEMGYPVYRRLGFREFCRMERYRWSL